MALFGLTRPVPRSRCCAATGSTCARRPRRTSRLVAPQSCEPRFPRPWEPTWPDDDLTRAAFRRRLRRQEEDIARDEAFSFLIFDQTATSCSAA